MAIHFHLQNNMHFIVIAWLLKIICNAIFVVFNILLISNIHIYVLSSLFGISFPSSVLIPVLLFCFFVFHGYNKDITAAV